MPMFYATLFLCTMAQPVCDVEHAFYATQSDPIFETDDDCHDRTFRHLQKIYLQIDGVEEGEKYTIMATCDLAIPTLEA